MRIFKKRLHKDSFLECSFRAKGPMLILLSSLPVPERAARPVKRSGRAANKASQFVHLECRERRAAIFNSSLPLCSFTFLVKYLWPVLRSQYLCQGHWERATAFYLEKQCLLLPCAFTATLDAISVSRSVEGDSSNIGPYPSPLYLTHKFTALTLHAFSYSYDGRPHRSNSCCLTSAACIID